MRKRTASGPFFLFLLPVFFVFHGWVAHARFIGWLDCMPLLAIYLLGAAMLWFLFRWLLRDNTRAALAASVVMVFYLFFGAIHDWLSKKGGFLHHYSVLLPLFLLLLVLLTLRLAKRPAPLRLAGFLNLLLVLFIVADGVVWLFRAVRKSQPAISASSLPPVAKCDTCPRPDIYLLIFDEYTGSRTLRETFHYDNSGLDSFLTSEGFHLQPESRSNYTVTPFSMASMLNLSYLKGVTHPRALEAEDYANIFEPLRTCEAVNFLLSQGYTVVNYSPFDIPEHPSSIGQPFIATGTRLITYRTMTDCIVRDLPASWKLGAWLKHLTSRATAMDDPVTTAYTLNETFLNETMQISAAKTGGPRFVYMHVAMPHAPFLFDSLFHRRSDKDALTPNPVLKDYLGYLPYTNSKIRQLIGTIRKNTRGKAVILFMSDHGFRYWYDNTPTSAFFRNQNAVYYPDGDYRGLYDSISNVNQFRVVFNKLFRLDLPLLKDSTILLLDKTD